LFHIPDSQWRNFDWRKSADGSGVIKWNSPFSLYAIYCSKQHGINFMQKKLPEELDEFDGQIENNICYSPDFLNYLLTHVFP